MRMRECATREMSRPWEERGVRKGVLRGSVMRARVYSRARSAYDEKGMVSILKYTTVAEREADRRVAGR